jgi:hypothetical protein
MTHWQAYKAMNSPPPLAKLLEKNSRRMTFSHGRLKKKLQNVMHVQGLE